MLGLHPRSTAWATGRQDDSGSGGHNGIVARSLDSPVCVIYHVHVVCSGCTRPVHKACAVPPGYTSRTKLDAGHEGHGSLLGGPLQMNATVS